MDHVRNAKQASHGPHEEQSQRYGKQAEACEPGVVLRRRRNGQGFQLDQPRNPRPKEVNIETPAVGKLATE